MHTYVYEISRKTIESLKLILTPSMQDLLLKWLCPETDYTEYKEELTDGILDGRFIQYNARINIKIHVANPNMWYYLTSSPFDEDDSLEMQILDQILCSLGNCLESL